MVDAKEVYIRGAGGCANDHFPEGLTVKLWSAVEVGRMYRCSALVAEQPAKREGKGCEEVKMLGQRS